ncbi:MAG TPA: pilin [Candidatus Saccharimonadales bacterium]|nr:pilin [Candidatus Saccharimonadales bacterium]
MYSYLNLAKNTSRILGVLVSVLILAAVAAAILPAAHTLADKGPNIPHTNIDPGALPQPDATVGGPNSTFGKLLSILFGIIAAFALLNIVLSGMKYITSAGNPQRSGEAKNGIIFSLVGLMIAVSAEAIIAFVINRASS